METHGSSGVEYEAVGQDYFDNRKLKRGAAGWVLLVGLGVAYVISGDYAGWNFGLEQGGWGGLMIASLLMALMYTCMCFALAELATIAPTAGGGYGFARRAFGPWGGFLTGTAILIEYAIAPAAIAVFIGGYMKSLFEIDIAQWVISGGFFAVFLGIHIMGAGEALRLIFAITALAVIALVVWCIAMVPFFDSTKLFDIAVNPEAAGASPFLPFGYFGIWAAIPFAMWFFLAIEGVPLAAEETQDPKRDLPRGLIVGMFILLAFCMLILVLGPGAVGSETLKTNTNPLVAALEHPSTYGGPTMLSKFVNFVGLAGLIASFFSIIYAYSRLIFAMSRAGYLPRGLSLTNSRQSPWIALIVPGIVGFLLSLTEQGDQLILMAVFGATISYILMMASHIKLRVSEPDLPRPYTTPGGILTSGIALVLACIALVAVFLSDKTMSVAGTQISVAALSAIAYAVFVAYFALYSRHHLVAHAPGEEDAG
ncbi:MAG: ethanolamine permease [Hyphomicrobium sp.]|nr:ethanolamine permease [Hyphomicrobium sp.]PPD07215.1 MAG: ethanolamine permease [Hyphomicrobium sp.]